MFSSYAQLPADLAPLSRLRARLRSESAPTEMPTTWSQLTTLGRIIAEGPTTTSALAQAEHVRRQSMAETIAALRANGLVTSEPDPGDHRKTLITATGKGRQLSVTIPAAREAWLSSAGVSVISWVSMISSGTSTPAR